MFEILFFFIGLGIGILLGMTMQYFFFKRNIQKITEEVQKIEKDNEYHDPSDWWKYGGDPFDHRKYDDDKMT